MKTLQPQFLKEKHYSDIVDQLRHIFYEIIYRPVSALLRHYTGIPSGAKKALLNARGDALRDALSKGRIQYEAGVFSGELSAAIGSDLRALGAKFNKRERVYRIPVSNVPAWVKAAAILYNTKAKEAHKIIARKLDEIQGDLDDIADMFLVDPMDAIEGIESDFNKLAKQLIVDPKLSPESRARLEKDYQQNMKLWIKKFSKEQIIELRKIVERNATKGYRFDTLIKGISSRYGVTANKAKFLARQETGLFMSKYRRERFSEAGVIRYKWSTSHDARVRPAPGTGETNNHRILDGRIFEYKHPPIVDPATGKRANPGEDYNCRCVDIAILEGVAA